MISFKIIDVLGKEKITITNQSYNQGNQQIKIPVTDLERGIYFLMISIDQEQINQKIIIE